MQNIYLMNLINSNFIVPQSTKNQWKIDDPVMKMTFINEILINFDLLFLSDNYLVMT